MIISYQHPINLLRLSNPFIIDRTFSLTHTLLEFTLLEKLSLTCFNPIYLGKASYSFSFLSMSFFIGDQLYRRWSK